MTFRFGWFSTGNDEAAQNLLKIVHDKVQEGHIPGEISFVFCNRDRGESAQSDHLIELARSMGYPTVTCSSSRFMPELRNTDREDWGIRFDDQVATKIARYPQDAIVLAGYMLIVSPHMCRRFTMINLHPALPDGPTGTWEEVIDEVIRRRERFTGVMMHLVTEALDRGPVVTYCAFPIRGEKWKALWEEDHGDRGPLFRRIREEGVRREIPLIVMTLKALAEGAVRIGKGGVIVYRGAEVKGGVSLTDEVERYLESKNESLCDRL